MDQVRRSLLKAAVLAPVALPVVAMGMGKDEEPTVTNVKKLPLVTWSQSHSHQVVSKEFKANMREVFEASSAIEISKEKTRYNEELRRLMVPVWVDKENALVIQFNEISYLCYGEMSCRISQTVYDRFPDRNQGYMSVALMKCNTTVSQLLNSVHWDNGQIYSFKELDENNKPVS